MESFNRGALQREASSCQGQGTVPPDTSVLPQERESEVALDILRRYFEIGEHFDVAQAFVDQASAYLALGDRQQAINSLQLALKREREYPKVKTQAWSEFALLVATTQEQSLYEYALDVVADNAPSSTSFPVDVFVGLLPMLSSVTL
jgi:tetratricopeptide (TPR) repeat protein